MTETREYDAVEIGIGLIRLGDCTCPEPLIICGRKVWASAYGRYARHNAGCENFKPYKEGLTQSCGNCKFWEAIEDMYE